MTSPSNDVEATSTTSSKFLGLETSTLVVLAALLLATIYALVEARTRRFYPPGPRGYPVLGYLDVLWSVDRRKLITELRTRYGDVFSFPLGCRVVVVVSGWDKLKQVFVSQGSSFLDKPNIFPIAHTGQGQGGIAGGGGKTSNSPAQTWKEHHEFTVNTLKNLTIGKHAFKDKVHEELEAFCNVLDATKGVDTDPAHVIETAVANIVCAVTFGKRFDYDDPIFARFITIFEESVSLSKGSVLLSCFPFLRYLPGDLFRCQKVMKNAEHLQGCLRQWMDAAKRRFNPQDVGDFMDAYFSAMEERKKRSQSPSSTLSHEQLLKLAGDLLVSGTENTASTLRWLLVFLVRWPHVQRKLRNEIDSVYPEKTTPSVQDRARMPYVEATILECQRFADIVPFSLMRAAVEGVEVEGHHVPRGSIIIPNLYSLHYDPDPWGDPENFVPERFLDADGKVLRRDYLLPFSVGMRSCPAEGLAMLELFLFLTTLIQRYEIRPASQGKLPSLDGRIGLTYSPLSYKVRFVRRDQPAEEENDAEMVDEEAKDSPKDK